MQSPDLKRPIAVTMAVVWFSCERLAQQSILRHARSPVRLAQQSILRHASLLCRAQWLCEGRGGRPGLPVPNSPYGLCGRKATLNLVNLRAQELCESRGGRPGLPVPNIPYGLYGLRATLNWNSHAGFHRFCPERAGPFPVPSKVIELSLSFFCLAAELLR